VPKITGMQQAAIGATFLEAIENADLRPSLHSSGIWGSASMGTRPRSSASTRGTFTWRAHALWVT
jgi:hypothetical protein